MNRHPRSRSAPARSRRDPASGNPDVRPVPGPRVRFAVVGLGHIAQTAVLPAFSRIADVCELAALVSDDPEKLNELAVHYPGVRPYRYRDFAACLESGIDAVYIALPNHLHHLYAIQAARAGVHVLCEKPMAMNPRQCEAMIRATEKSATRLMIAYRLHFERASLRSIATASSDQIGDPRFFSSIFSMQVANDDIRVQRSLGGGTLLDIGIYCVNVARHLFGQEPIEVWATASRSRDPRFAEVDEMTSAVMRFPEGRLASFTCSFGAAPSSSYDLIGTTGSIRLESAYEYSEAMRQRLVVNGAASELVLPTRDQFAAEIAYFSKCLLDGTKPGPSGDEGLADIRVINALMRSCKVGRPVRLPPLRRNLKRPSIEQVIDMPPPTVDPPTVHTRPPEQDA